MLARIAPGRRGGAPIPTRPNPGRWRARPMLNLAQAGPLISNSDSDSNLSSDDGTKYPDSDPSSDLTSDLTSDSDLRSDLNADLG